jgi:hypothetical protein
MKKINGIYNGRRKPINASQVYTNSMSVTHNNDINNVVVVVCD